MRLLFSVNFMMVFSLFIFSCKTRHRDKNTSSEKSAEITSFQKHFDFCDSLQLSVKPEVYDDWDNYPDYDYKPLKKDAGNIIPFVATGETRLVPKGCMPLLLAPPPAP